MVFTYIILFIVTIIVSTLAFFKRRFSYWHKRNIPYIQPQMPFGTIENPLNRKQDGATLIQKQYHHLKSLGHKYGGLYLSIRPALLLVDVELIRNVMSKDFQYFTDRGFYYNEKDSPLTANLFNLGGHKWRTLRTRLTPTFTSGKMKTMFPTIVACAVPLRMEINESLQRQGPVEIKDVLARFTTDVIGSCAFGLECNSFNDPESDFRKYGINIFTITSKIKALKLFVLATFPSFSRKIRIAQLDLATTRFFMKIVEDTVNYRKKNGVVRNDFIQLLIELQIGNDGLTIKEIAAQAFVFFAAGFETSSNAMTFCLCELAVNQELQSKVRYEINKILAKHNGSITYDAVMEMTYLGNVIDETLRKYPAGEGMRRMCGKNYQIPDTDVIIEKGTTILIPVYALHHDPEYFPNPEIFDPERFNDKNKRNITPFTYLPFGEGPRTCIGLRFGLLQTKVGLIMLVKNFKFSLNYKTRFPIHFDESQRLTLTPKDGVWLNIEREPGE